ncbi:hypothetical protein KUTeg_022116 [Tegillarca granosa]|uniref:G-protein coupled receptors family 1 profile domain-containing protein n=1 Tax=Tegillarca granosa TaxID=220873 RepID=A0ABQ9EAL6_TEGGR|nr:hypothetical protein KUTeg_022116 [Tegillarca granosa]
MTPSETRLVIEVEYAEIVRRNNFVENTLTTTRRHFDSVSYSIGYLIFNWSYWKYNGVTVGPSFFLKNLWICHIVSIVCVMGCVSSMLNLAAIAINRYILITKSHIDRNIYTKRRRISICLALWFLAFLVELSNLVGWGGHAFDFKTLGCSFDRLISLPYTLFLGLVALWNPLIIIFYCYIQIYRRVSKTKKQLRKISVYSKDKKRSRKLQDDSNLGLTFFVVFMSFLTCLASFDQLLLIDRKDRCPQWVLVHFNSSLNSILYGLTNNRFRDGYSTFFKKICNYKEKKTDEKEVEKGLTDLDNSTNNNLSSVCDIKNLVRAQPEVQRICMFSKIYFLFVFNILVLQKYNEYSKKVIVKEREKNKIKKERTGKEENDRYVHNPVLRVIMKTEITKQIKKQEVLESNVDEVYQNINEAHVDYEVGTSA